MLPVSGAAQLNTSEANSTRPMISARGAYSRLVSPGASKWKLSSSLGAPECGGMKSLQSPSAFALAVSASFTGGTCERSAPKPAICAS